MRYSNRPTFIKHLKSSNRLYVVAIADDVERNQLFAAILNSIQTPDSILLRFSGMDMDLRAILDHLQTPSLLGGEPIAILDEAEKLTKKEAAGLQQVLASPLSFGYLLIGTRGKSPLIAAADQHGVVLDALDEKPWEKEKRLQEMLEQKARSAGKTLSADVIALMFERLDKESAVLEKEMDKLICYTGDKAQIQASDAAAILSSSRSFALWQSAEEFVWERKEMQGAFEESLFYALLPALRSQLQLGLKIASLLESNASREEWSQALPRIFPRTLEKRTSQAAKLGSGYFIKGLKALFDVELQSRTGSQQLSALLDLLRAKLAF